MTDPNAPARYNDEANVEPTAREGEVVPEVETVLPEVPCEAEDADEPKSGGASYSLEVVVTDGFREGLKRLMEECERLGYIATPPRAEDPITPFVPVSVGYAVNLREDGTWSTFVRVPPAKKLPPGN